MGIFIKGLIACGLTAAMALPLSADVKVKTKRESGGHT